MTVLVLCIDRDNDLGEKAGIQSPIVGRQANLDAAVKLAVVDPEDSDANSVFGAVNALDELIADGEEAEVVTLLGDKRVGALSDRKITRDLEAILKRLKPDRCVFVTDGAEDEYILPLVTSRIRVEAVRRVIVKQNQDLESTYYVIKRALEDDKLQRTLLMPIALALLMYGLFAVIGKPDLGVGAISLTVGAYFLARVLHVGANVRRIVSDVYSGLTAGKVSLFTSLLAILVVLAGVVLAGRAVLLARSLGFTTTGDVVHLALIAAESLLWWLVVGALIGAGGKVIDAYLRDGILLWSYWSLPFGLVAAGLILTAAFRVAQNVTARSATLFGVDEMLYVVAGFIFAFTGTVTSTYVRQRAEREARAESGPAEAPAEAAPVPDAPR